MAWYRYPGVQPGKLVVRAGIRQFRAVAARYDKRDFRYQATYLAT
jgi:hypothetical protein